MIKGYKRGDGRIELGGIDLAMVEAGESSGLIDQINSICQPPTPVTADDVYVRRIRLVGDGLFKAFMLMGGMGLLIDLRFRTTDLPKILAMIQNRPLLSHHMRDLPIGRWFGGEIIKVGEFSFVAPNCYWMRGTEKSEEIRLNLDGGVWREASIGLSFKQITCSICEKELDSCEHAPGKSYDGKICHGWADEITDVYEGSLVDRGAHPGTGIEPKVKLQQEFRIQKSEEGKMELAKLAAALGVEPDEGGEVSYDQALAGAVLLASRAADLQAKVDALTPLAARGEEYLEARRAEGMTVALKAALFQKRELSDAEKAQINGADIDGLNALGDTHHAALDAAAPEYECPHCHGKIRSLRRSDPGGDNTTATARMPRAASFRTR